MQQASLAFCLNLDTFYCLRFFQNDNVGFDKKLFFKRINDFHKILNIRLAEIHLQISNYVISC